jgi:hypothetical protein
MLNGFQNLQIQLAQGGYDGSATPKASPPPQIVRHNHTPQQAQPRNEGYSPRQRTPRQVRLPRSAFYHPRTGDKEILKAWGAYVNGGHVEDDARLYKEAERLYNAQKQEWLQQQQQHQTMANAENQEELVQENGDTSRTLTPDSMGMGTAILDGFIPATVTTDWKYEGQPAINLMD